MSAVVVSYLSASSAFWHFLERILSQSALVAITAVPYVQIPNRITFERSTCLFPHDQKTRGSPWSGFRWTYTRATIINICVMYFNTLAYIFNEELVNVCRLTMLLIRDNAASKDHVSCLLVGSRLSENVLQVVSYYNLSRCHRKTWLVGFSAPIECSIDTERIGANISFGGVEKKR